MRPLLAMITFAAACACPRATPAPTPSPVPVEVDPMPTPVTRPATPPAPAANDCQRALLALAAGELTGWNGADGCTRADADHVFGGSGRADSAGSFGPEQTYRVGDRYVRVSYAGDGAIKVIVLYHPQFAAGTAAALGAAETTARSGLGKDHEQRVYAGRGLTVHVDLYRHDVAAVVAYPRMTAAQFLELPYAREIRAEEEHEVE